MEKLEREILKICSHFQHSYPSMHQTMAEIEKLDSSFSTNAALLHIKCRWITAVANLPCFKPDSSLGAEVQVNSLLQFMASSSCAVRALACSLMRIFCVALNPLGSHVTTQVTIICKNLVTTAEESLEIKDFGFDLCYAVACSSLCCITVHWASILSASNSVHFVLLTLKFLLGTLGKPKEKHHKFCYQVVVDGMVRVLKVSDLWTYILTEKEQQDIITRVLVHSQNHDHLEQDFVSITTLLQIFDNEDIMRTILKSADISGQLLAYLIDLLPAVFPSQELPHPLEVRWTALYLIKQFVKVADPEVDSQHLRLVTDKGCFTPPQVAQLHQIVVNAFQHNLSRIAMKT